MNGARVAAHVKSVSNETGRVAVGCRVMYRDDDELEQVVIVPEADADYSRGLISSSSPVARALLGHDVGDPVRAWTPGGIRGAGSS